MGERWAGSSPQARGGWDAPRTGEADAWCEDEEKRRPPPCGVEAAGEACKEEDPSVESRRSMWVWWVSEVWRTGDEPRTGDADPEPRWEATGDVDTGDVCLEEPSVWLKGKVSMWM